MKKFAVVAISLAVLVSPGAFAQGKTRTEVYQELIEAQQSGLNHVTETSYPDVNPMSSAEIDRMKQAHLAQQNAASKIASGGTSVNTAN
jgi:predicted RNase H-like HicB family nuclease